MGYGGTATGTGLVVLSSSWLNKGRIPVCGLLSLWGDFRQHSGDCQRHDQSRLYLIEEVEPVDTCSSIHLEYASSISGSSICQIWDLHNQYAEETIGVLGTPKHVEVQGLDCCGPKCMDGNSLTQLRRPHTPYLFERNSSHGWTECVSRMPQASLSHPPFCGRGQHLPHRARYLSHIRSSGSEVSKCTIALSKLNNYLIGGSKCVIVFPNFNWCSSSTVHTEVPGRLQYYARNGHSGSPTPGSYKVLSH